MQEAIVNAIAHRDYESEQPIRVTVFSDRIEIVSPGALPRAVDPEKFKQGKAPAYWRNQSLAYFLNKLQLAQAEGQGIPTIIRTMQEEGCPPPVFETGEDSVTCVLPAHPRHAVMRELNAIENKIILGNHEEALARLETLLERDPYNFRSLELYAEVNGLLRTPKRVFEFVTQKKLDPKLINSGTLLVLAELLLQVKDDKDIAGLANAFLSQAMSERLEESEVKRVVLGYRKMKNDEKALELIESVIEQSPVLATSSSLRDLAARAKIDLAKKCVETGRNRSMRGDTRRKAWDLCRQYLNSAEKDLTTAIEHVKNDLDRDYIQRDLEFLNYMKQLARKPEHRNGHARAPRAQQKTDVAKRLASKYKVRK